MTRPINNLRTYAGVFAAVLISSLVASNAQAAWSNGWWVFPYKYYQKTSFTSRCMNYDQSAAGIRVADRRIYGLEKNAKGINITSTIVNNAYSIGFRKITIWHCEISDVWRTPGGHVDFIRIAGGLKQNVPSTIYLQNIWIHDGDGIPFLFERMWCDKMTLKDIKVERTTVGIQIAPADVGYIDTLVLDNINNTSVGLIGRPGSIRVVYVRNCKNFRVGDAPGPFGLTGAKIVYLK